MQADPSLVRDGDVAVNRPPAHAPAITDVINAVLNDDAAAATPPLGTNVTGLGPAGNAERAVLSPPITLGQLAVHHARRAGAGQRHARPTSSATEQAVQTTLSSKLSSQSGVDMDTEMSNMIAAAERLWRQRQGHRRRAGDVDAIAELGP